ncbi:hypothetical protein FK531_04270 [Rhodococcus spelaei]|uniref:Tat pathway signal protein n=1 Tax=Rhodococcus spelaei TaxID=2546320 RepID=A0A541BNS3_9NOCA|nr:hypothetical protein [Rhodococcus spelaei]TQF73898.1 hypothetical protein FK531_04270 [Rhodococcus spelaei]
MSARIATRPAVRPRAWLRGVLVAVVGAAAVTVATGATPAAAQSAAYAQFLDITPTNSNAELAGGLDPRLPTASAVLGAALASARADHVAPTRYAALLHQYWLALGTETTGIDLATWDPNVGFAANATLVDRVYANYGRYQREHAELNWAGMAGMAGASFAAGFWDIDGGRTALTVDAVHRLGTAVGAAVGTLPTEAAALLPADVRTLATLGPAMTAEDLDWYQKRLLIMQKHIYFDMVPMHEAYARAGRPAIEELAAAGLLDANAETAWQGIFSGTAEGRADATRRMADREQNQVVADQWDATASSRGGVGRALSYVTTVAAQPSIPGTRAPGVASPLSVVGTVGGATYRLQAPLPDFNWADRVPRWSYIGGDTVPAYQRLVETRPAEAYALLAQPFPDFVDQQRVLRRVPALARDLGTGWSLTREP